MMPNWQVILIGALAVLLAVVSALAGALWSKARLRALVDVAHLAEMLAARLRRLDEVLSKLEGEPKPARRPGNAAMRAGRDSLLAPVVAASPGPSDALESVGPTLIAVPDLAEPAAHTAPGSAAAELGERFVAIGKLAETGASADQIARRTGQPIGQVELILSLLEAARAGSRRS